MRTYLSCQSALCMSVSKPGGKAFSERNLEVMARAYVVSFEQFLAPDVGNTFASNLQTRSLA